MRKQLRGSKERGVGERAFSHFTHSRQFFGKSDLFAKVVFFATDENREATSFLALLTQHSRPSRIGLLWTFTLRFCAISRIWAFCPSTV